ncbi:MAG: hypothetical protein P9L99_05900 [Candidatus Lernaella stagnicola]|nr:hypothetical protein [Candidatus Lernaella stagnicola]
MTDRARSAFAGERRQDFICQHDQLYEQRREAYSGFLRAWCRVTFAEAGFVEEW